jgi:NADPH:quinone reductase-like Zn-dependent oxidoreductase
MWPVAPAPSVGGVKAMVQRRYGGPEVLALADVPVPVAGAGEVLVAVRAASVNAADWHVMRGDPYLARVMSPAVFGRRGPKRAVRGHDVAGVVAAVGGGVSDLAVGDEVFGNVGFDAGTFAEYVVAPAELLAPKPVSLSDEQAAAVPLAGSTAVEALADVRAGQRVLVNGAAGGVGTFAVQIAHARGAEVTGVCRAERVDLVASLGADHVIDRGAADFAAGPGRYDVVLDLVGDRSLRDLRRAAAPDGTILLSGGGISRGGSLVGPMGLIIRGQLASRFVPQRVRVFSSRPHRDHLLALTELIDAGRIAPVIDRAYPLADVPEAIRRLEAGQARGKVVITM